MRPILESRIGCCFVIAALAQALTGKLIGETVPGVVIDHSSKTSGVYFGSPSIAIWTNGDYVASHDDFGPHSTLATTTVFISQDKGRTWIKTCVIAGQYWSTLFIHHEALYLMGTSREYGKVVIRRSPDGGHTWTEPKDASSGLLRAGAKHHCAPVPVVVCNGRIWRAMEDVRGPGKWAAWFRAFMMSAPENADLLNATNWTWSNVVGSDTNWLDGKFGGWLEGNAVVTPDGKIVDLLRCDMPTPHERAAIIRISDDGRRATFEPGEGFVDFPGGAKKFTVRFDPQSKQYWSLANAMIAGNANNQPGAVRNALALITSSDLRHWEIRRELLYHTLPAQYGFQYCDWQFDGDDLIAVVRTAFDDSTGGAHNFHDANYLTFHRFSKFRVISDESLAGGSSTVWYRPGNGN